VTGSGRSGVHIAFTGTDGSGKSTQAGLLTRRLNEGGAQAYLAEAKDDFAFQVLRRVTGAADSVGVRRELGNDVVNVVAALDTLRDHARTTAPLLAAGIHVVSPRSMYCRLAVGFAFGTRDLGPTRQILALADPPDLVFWLDVPAGEAVRRVASRGRDREEPGFLRALRDGIAHAVDGDRVHRVEAGGPADEVHEAVWRIVRTTHPNLDPRRSTTRSPRRGVRAGSSHDL
jgi:thymidylate kinase